MVTCVNELVGHFWSCQREKVTQSDKSGHFGMLPKLRKVAQLKKVIQNDDIGHFWELSKLIKVAQLEISYPK